MKGNEIIAIVAQQIVDDMPFNVYIEDKGEVLIMVGDQDDGDVVVNLEQGDEGPGYWRALMWPHPYGGESAEWDLFNISNPSELSRMEETIGNWLRKNEPQKN